MKNRGDNLWLAAARVKYNERVTGAVQIDYVANVAATLNNSVYTWCIWIESGGTAAAPEVVYARPMRRTMVM
jgi:hypothetical protein